MLLSSRDISLFWHLFFFFCRLTGHYDCLPLPWTMCSTEKEAQPLQCLIKDVPVVLFSFQSSSAYCQPHPSVLWPFLSAFLTSLLSLSHSFTPKQMVSHSLFIHSQHSSFSHLVKHGPGLCNELELFNMFRGPWPRLQLPQHSHQCEVTQPTREHNAS